MDYKYIEQLLDRYWNGETSLEEERILRAFFSQENIPEELRQYKPLFAYEQAEPAEDVLGDDFDSRMLSMIDEQETPVKARVVTMNTRLRPLFKAAAIVAIFLTLGNAAQSTFENGSSEVKQGYEQTVHKGSTIAMGDSAQIDTLQQSSIQPIDADASQVILK